MAGDWIKMRHNLETDPDVLWIAQTVGIDRFSVVGRLHMLWSWADQHSVDGCAISATNVFLDEHVCCAGFCNALRSVGWLSGEDWDLSFPNFVRHNGKSAKKRAQAQKTMAKRRSSEKQAPENVARFAQPEKRREEKSNSISIDGEQNEKTIGPKWLNEEPFVSAWAAWKQYRREINKPVTDSGQEAQQMAIDRVATSPEDAAAMVRFSIEKEARNVITNGGHRETDHAKPGGANRFPRRKTPTFEEAGL